MLNVECRLCSSTRALISLFGGKSRVNRDYIRKLVDVTTGIKFQTNDSYKCICFSCIIQIYNFYIFRIRSKENEKRLQVYTENSEKIKSHKIEVQHLDDIILPSIEELKVTLTPWLISKEEYCKNISTEDDENTDRCNGLPTSSNAHEKELVECSTQYDSVAHFSKSTQYEWSRKEEFTQTKKLATKTIKIQCEWKKECKEFAIQTDDDNTDFVAVESISKDTQCELANTEAYSQTEKLPTNSIKIQCELGKTNQTNAKNKHKSFSTQTDEDNTDPVAVESINKETQRELARTEAYSQTEKFSTKSIRIQCELGKTNQTNAKNKRKSFATQTDENRIPHGSVCNKETRCTINQEISKTGSNESTQTNESSVSYSVVPSDKETQCEVTTAEVQIQTNETVTKTTEFQNELPKSHRKSLRRSCIERTAQAQSTSELNYSNQSTQCTQCSYDSGIVELKSNLRLMDIKQETRSPSPPILSPIKCLSIDINSSKDESLVSSSSGYASPRTSDLLTVKNKIQNVIICQECDQAVYSKNEYKLHRKSHMQCSFCKKKFQSVKRTKLHVQSDCDIQKLIKIEPVVSLVRLESLAEIREKYPKCFEILKQYHKLGYDRVNGDKKKIVRMRSRSISSIDSFVNCTTCRGCISVLKTVSIGVDKSVQANFFFDRDLISPLQCFYNSVYIKRNLQDSVEDNTIPVKKLKHHR